MLLKCSPQGRAPRQRGEVELYFAPRLLWCWINLASLAVCVYNERNYIRDERSWGNFKAAKGNKPMENDEVRPHMPHTHQQLPAPRFLSLALSRAPPHQKSLKMLQKLIQSGTLKASKAARTLHAPQQAKWSAASLAPILTRGGSKYPDAFIYSKLFLNK